MTFGLTAYNPASQLLGRTASNDSYAWTAAAAMSRDYAVNGPRLEASWAKIAPSSQNVAGRAAAW